MSECRGSGGSGCSFIVLEFIVSLFLISLWWVGVQTPWGRFEIDLFPPAIYCSGCK